MNDKLPFFKDVLMRQGQDVNTSPISPSLMLSLGGMFGVKISFCGFYSFKIMVVSNLCRHVFYTTIAFPILRHMYVHTQACTYTCVHTHTEGKKLLVVQLYHLSGMLPLAHPSVDVCWISFHPLTFTSSMKTPEIFWGKINFYPSYNEDSSIIAVFTACLDLAVYFYLFFPPILWTLTRQKVFLSHNT